VVLRAGRRRQLLNELEMAERIMPCEPKHLPLAGGLPAAPALMALNVFRPR